VAEVLRGDGLPHVDGSVVCERRRRRGRQVHRPFNADRVRVLDDTCWVYKRGRYYYKRNVVEYPVNILHLLSECAGCVNILSRGSVSEIA
jgi:hypothetical protein